MRPSEAIKIINGLIKSVELAYNSNPLTDKEQHPATEALNSAISALEKQEADRWIPVTERLPEEDGDYLVTNFVCDKLYVEESAFIICDNGDVFWTSQNVIAWMTKPEPYKAKEKS